MIYFGGETMQKNNVNKELLIDFFKTNKEYFQKEFHIKEIGIFGSYARGEEKPGSDIDLLVEFDESIQDIYDVKMKLKEILKEKFGKETDIARKKYLKQRVKDKILKDTIYV